MWKTNYIFEIDTRFEKDGTDLPKQEKATQSGIIQDQVEPR